MQLKIFFYQKEPKNILEGFFGFFYILFDHEYFSQIKSYLYKTFRKSFLGIQDDPNEKNKQKTSKQTNKQTNKHFRLTISQLN